MPEGWGYTVFVDGADKRHKELITRLDKIIRLMEDARK